MALELKPFNKDHSLKLKYPAVCLPDTSLKKRNNILTSAFGASLLKPAATQTLWKAS